MGRVWPREWCWGERDHRTAVYCEVPSVAMVEEPDLGRCCGAVCGAGVLGGVGTCGGRGGGRGGGVGGGTAEE